MARQLLFRGDRVVDIQPVEIGAPGDGEVLIGIGAAGVCGSDLHYLFRVPAAERGKPRLGVTINPDAVPGHEPAGTVLQAGAGTRKLRAGDRVVVHHISGCGICDWCIRDLPMHCPDKNTYGFDIDGAFADSMLAKEKDCVRIPDALSTAAASYLACGAGTAYNAVKKLGTTATDRIVIVGLGPVGLAAVQFAAARGAQVIAVDPSAERRELARQVGADLLIDPIAEDALALVRAFTDGRLGTVGIDCSGNGAARRSLLDLVGPWARVAFVGEGGDVTIDVSQQIIHKQITLIGSWVFGLHELAEAMQYVADRGIDLDQLITDRFDITEAQAAFDVADGAASGKVIITMEAQR
ncbi:zinc-binding dehydrogenase [Herbiconiux sp. YIM B11900]|uniref:zinc-binding dehydrogenase n=1 Tax=Herbiconiux sp. YIM B11900 TaxID=3404131 RepID=UPI003F86398D